MSWFTFIASDVELEGYCIGIYRHRDRNKIIVETEDRTLNIYREQYEGYPEQYTTIPHIVGVEFGNYENIRDELLAYMKNAISMCRKFEVWSVWLDDPDHDVQVRKFKAEELSEEDMAWIFNQKYFEHPQCLRMYRWQRG